MDKTLDENDTRSLCAVLNKSWKQYPTKQMYSHSPLISQTSQQRRTKLAGQCWGSTDELRSDILSWTPIHGYISVGRLKKLTFTSVLWILGGF